MLVGDEQYDNRRLGLRVYSKWLWTDPWEQQPTWQPLTASYTASPTMPAATFKIAFGAGRWEDGSELIDGDEMESLLYCYVQIRAYYKNADETESEETIWWTGVVPAEQFDLLGQDSTEIKTADQTIQAYGLEYLLDKRIETAMVEDFGDTGTKQIGSLPTFNKRHDHGGEILGNRSSSMKQTSEYPFRVSYVFSPSTDLWTNDDIINYLLTNCQDPNGPQFVYGGGDTMHLALAGLVGIHDPNGLTIKQLLDKLISRSMGFSWTIAVGSDDTVIILPFSLLDEDLVVNGKTIPANTDRINADLWTDPAHSTVKPTRDSASEFDRIVVRGAKIKSCFTAGGVGDDLEIGWTSTEETAYKDAGKNIADYSGMTDEEKKDVNDQVRGLDKFARVYTHFRMPKDWDWTIGGQYVVPKFDDDGEQVDDTGSQYWNVDKRFLNYLPFKAGFDYSGATPVDKNPADTEPEFLPIIAFMQNAAAMVRHVESLPSPASVRPLQRELGIEVRFHPRHLCALNHFSSAEPTDKDPEFDYETLAVTGFVESDTHIQVAWECEDYDSLENRKTLIIDMPECELWYVVPGTIVAVDNTTGATVAYGGDVFIRDDRDILRQVLAAAASWYGKRRTKLQITLDRIDCPAAIGQMVSQLAIGSQMDSGACAITSIRWNFESQRTMVDSDFGELDAAALLGGRAARGTRSTPSLASAAKKIETLTRQVREIKTELGKSPVRQGQAKETTIGHVFRAETTEAATNRAYIIANLLGENGDPVTSGDGYHINVYCDIAGGGNLNAAVPRLVQLDCITVYRSVYNNSGTPELRWYCTTIFQASQDCG